MSLPLQARLGIAFGSLLLFPAGAYLGCYRGEMLRYDAVQAELRQKEAAEAEKSARLRMLSQRAMAHTAPKPPEASACLDALAALKVEGLAVEERSRDLSATPGIRVSLRGGYRQVGTYLDAASALPFRTRLGSLTLSPVPAERVLEGEAFIEVLP